MILTPAGETSFSLTVLANDSESVECNQPLLVQNTPRATWLLDVLGSRQDDNEALRFVQERKSNVLGRVPGGSKVSFYYLDNSFERVAIMYFIIMEA